MNYMGDAFAVGLKAGLDAPLMSLDELATNLDEKFMDRLHSMVAWNFGDEGEASDEYEEASNG